MVVNCICIYAQNSELTTNPRAFSVLDLFDCDPNITVWLVTGWGYSHWQCHLTQTNVKLSLLAWCGSSRQNIHTLGLLKSLTLIHVNAIVAPPDS